jgi:hypothetical protein
MIKNSHKTSLLIPSQLPEFIRDNPDYEKFVAFIQAYYEWMEQNGGATDGSKNILNYADIDKTSEEFLNYYVNDFLPNFPSETLVDKRLAIKVAKQLYETKGTPASYQFLFRVLFNSDFDLFYTKDAVLKASSGVWYIPKSLKLATTDKRFLKTNNLRIFGETSGSIATIENTVVSGNKIEVFISNIERLFQSGEIVRIVDNLNQTLYFDGVGTIVPESTSTTVTMDSSAITFDSTELNMDNGNASILSAKLVGQVNQIKIDPNNRGLFYSIGDPVIVHGGTITRNPVEASAVVGEITKGSIISIDVTSGGYGYTQSPNTRLIISNAPGAIATPASFNPSPDVIANVKICTDTITLKRFITIGNSSLNFANAANGGNANTTLLEAFTFTSFQTFPISSVYVNNGGGGISVQPTIYADSIYYTDAQANTADSEYGIAHLVKLGILAPIQIVNPGTGYQANDKIVFTSGTGFGAYANVISVTATGGINTVSYVSGSYLTPGTKNPYPLGGLGYKPDALPTLSVQSANVGAANAVLVVTGILGDGAQFSPTTDRTGSITSINITNYGEDYSSTPSVSIKIQDVLVSNVLVATPPAKNDFVYQGDTINTASMLAYVDSFNLIQENVDPTQSLYNIRLYDYNRRIDTNLPIKFVGKQINLTPANTAFEGRNYDTNGIKIYGDGKAKASATFLNGLTYGQGQYISTKGLVSSFDVLQSLDYNNYTYQITVEKEIEKYRDTLLKLIHPSGLKVIGRYAVKSNSEYYFHAVDAYSKGYPLAYYTEYLGTTVTINTDFDNKTNNIIQFNNLAGANLAGFIFAANTNQSASVIELSPRNGPNIISEVVSVDPIANTVTLKSNAWLTFSNVAIATSNLNSNTINIVQLTGYYDYYNSGKYSNTQYPLKDIVFAGDLIKLGSSIGTVQSVDYVTGIITLTSDFGESANSYLSVRRTFVANSLNQVYIYGTVGLQYIPELTTEDGRTLITEDGLIIILG